ncbi:MBL fold metallo-hydrolase [bacterium]|nr:MBL fold metallo-hydrolase [bacterium]
MLVTLGDSILRLRANRLEHQTTSRPRFPGEPKLAQRTCLPEVPTLQLQHLLLMKITFFGAAGEVTGSAYLVQTEKSRLLIDFGMFQGESETAGKNCVPAGLDPTTIDAVVITHGHLDHTGRLPLLTKAGYRGPIHATSATIDMSGLILRDSAKVQAQDIERTNRKRLRAGKDLQEPLYNFDDVERTMQQFKAQPYREPVPIAPDVSVRFVEAGHMLGSASLQLTITESGRAKTVVFSGDLGPADLPVLRDAECLNHADLVIMESTYGDRDHRSLTDTLNEARDIIKEAVKLNGKILVPAFAVGRTQQIIYHVLAMFRNHEVPPFPIYIDSPMAIEATRIYEKHPELYDEEARRLADAGLLNLDLHGVKTCQTADESKALNDLSGTLMIIAGAGMCNAGRILHHLRNHLWKENTTVIIVGYQAEGSLGRLLVEGRPEVRIFGEEIAVKATIHSLGGFSAHAGQSDLMKWFNCLAHAKPQVVLTHGEAKGREPLAQLIKERHGLTARLPMFGETIEL